MREFLSKQVINRVKRLEENKKESNKNQEQDMRFWDENHWQCEKCKYLNRISFEDFDTHICNKCY